MRRALSLTAAIVLAAAATYGCDKETPEDQLDVRLDEYEAELNEQVEILCDCWEQASYESRTACKEDVGEILPAKRRCYDDAFKRDVDASNDYLECVLPLEAEYTTCLNDKYDCDDIQGSRQACNEDYQTGRENCIDLPASIERAIDDCNN